MARSAVPVGVVAVATALLAGCSSPAPAPTRFEPRALVDFCPPGFVSALAAFVEDHPVEGAVPDQLKVVDIPGHLFPDAVDDLLEGACGAQLELVVGGDIHVLDVVVTDPGTDAGGVLAAAGWTADGASYTDGSGQQVRVYPVADADGTALGFPEWSEYFHDDQEVLVTSPRV